MALWLLNLRVLQIGGWGAEIAGPWAMIWGGRRLGQPGYSRCILASSTDWSGHRAVKSGPKQGDGTTPHSKESASTA